MGPGSLGSGSGAQGDWYPSNWQVFGDIMEVLRDEGLSIANRSVADEEVLKRSTICKLIE